MNDIQSHHFRFTLTIIGALLTFAAIREPTARQQGRAGWVVRHTDFYIPIINEQTRVLEPPN